MELVAADLPLISRARAEESAQQFIVESVFDPVADPFLAGHQYKGAPIVPAAAILELFAQAAVACAPGNRVAGFSGVRFHNGLRFFNARLEPVRIVCTPIGPDRMACELRHDFRSSQGTMMEQDRLYTTGIVELTKDVAESYPISMPEDILAPRPVQYADTARMWFGLGMRCLKSLRFAGNEGWGEIVGDELAGLGGRQGDRWRMSPAVFDAALVGCAVYTSVTRERLQMPSVIDAIALGPRFTRAGEVARLAFRFLGIQQEQAVFEWSLFGEDGVVLCTASGYRCDLVAGRPGECLLGAGL